MARTRKLFPTSLVGSYPQPEWLIDRPKLAGRFPPRIRMTELWRVAPEYLEQAQDDASIVAIQASDLTLVSGDLRAAADAIRLSRRTLRTIKQNLGWAFGYNVAAVPLAAAGFLNPVIAGAAMALSSISVVVNALRLRRFRSDVGGAPTAAAARRA